MKKIAVLLLILSLMPVSGCAVRDAILPLHDEVLVYPLPYDLTYLRTVEAVENVAGWELEETEKEKGIIGARNVNYSRFADADKRLIRLAVKRVSRNETSIQILPASQRVIGGDKILNRIREFLDAEI